MFRRLFVSALVSVVATSTLTGTGEAAAQPYVPALTWVPCQEGKPGETAGGK